MRKRLALGFSVFAIGASACIAQAISKTRSPQMTVEQARSIAQTVLDTLAPRIQGSLGLVAFNSSAQVWDIGFGTRQPDGRARYGDILLDERSGMARLKMMATTGCTSPPAKPCAYHANDAAATHGMNVSPQIQSAIHAVRTARRTPPPQLPAMAIALTRYLITSDGSPAARTRAIYFLSQESRDGQTIDLPSSSLQTLSSTGLRFAPGSEWAEADTRRREDVHLLIGLPVLRPDGDYSVSFSSSYHGSYGSRDDAVMRRDANGWHVIGIHRSNVAF